jgi:hypothetical protein
MPSMIQDFLGNFTDVAKPSRFEVTIGSKVYYNDINPNDLILRCETAELPSRTYATAEQKFGSNPVEKFPYQVQFNDLNLTFIVDDDMQAKYFFDAWLEAVIPSSRYNPNYKDTYSCTINIRQYNNYNELSYSVDLLEAYPISVNQLDLDWSAEGHHKLTVVFAYTSWQKTSTYRKSQNRNSNKLFNAFNPNSEL